MRTSCSSPGHAPRVSATWPQGWPGVAGLVFTGVMRAIWKGALTFGLVNVPVKVYSATEDHDVSLHQVHNTDGGRIRYQRMCEIDGEVVPYQDIDKAYDDGERTVVLTDGRPRVAARPSAAARSTSSSSCRASRSTC